MALKLKCKSKEEVPAELQLLYVEREGAFVLSLLAISLRTNSVHLRLDLLDRHGLTRLGPDIPDHFEKATRVGFRTQLAGNQSCDSFGIEQARGTGSFCHIVGQIQFYGNAHKFRWPRDPIRPPRHG
jgi:hypothetical protein